MWHVRSRNIPQIVMMVYLEIELLNTFVNAIIWGGEDFYNAWRGYGWCDVMVRLQLGTSIGLASCATCILLKLFFIFLANDVTVFWFENRWAQPATEIVLSIVIPLLLGGLSIFAQPSRYFIFRATGCVPTLGKDTISVLLFYFWIMFFSLVDLVLSGATLVIFYAKRRAARDILVCTNSGLSMRRFSRLLIFCLVVTILSIVLSCLVGVQLRYMTSTLYSKETLQGSMWGFIFMLEHNKSQDYHLWTIVVISFANFLIFGIGSDAAEMYGDIIRSLGGGRFLGWAQTHCNIFSVATPKETPPWTPKGTPSGNSNGGCWTPWGKGEQSSPAETYFTYAGTTKSQNESGSPHEMDLDPAVRSHLLGAELELGKNDNLREFEYLYFNE